ncbi:MAG: hypothetical protein P1S46_10595 [bacterium]|nr:hypothetical protein [bacterium]MDT8396732.1 hypothetical protein [bacterium]
MKRKAAWLIVFMLVAAAPSDAAKDIVSPGDFLPDFRFVTSLSTGDAAYLGVAEEISGKGHFLAQDVWGDILVVELFNRFCYGCQQGAPIINRAYELVASDPFLSTRVRFLGVGVGNNQKTVDDFSREFGVQFPLVPDPKFSLLDALGNPGGTPYTMILRRTKEGMMLMGAHFGVLDSAGEFVREVREVAEGDVEQLIASAQPVELAAWVEKELKPDLTDARIEELVLQCMERAGYGSVGLYTVDLPDGGKVYVGESGRGKVFSRVISRLPVCDVCHPIHFILTVSLGGQVVDFDSISVTKYWNKEWTAEEIDWMRKRLLGQSVLKERAFDPEVDAVSTATISSSLIFDSLSRTGPLVRILKDGGHL